MNNPSQSPDINAWIDQVEQRLRLLESPRTALPKLPPTIFERVTHATSKVTHIPVEKIRSADRSRDIVSARRVCYLILRDLGFSLSSIGRHFGRDHTTVHSALRVPPRVRIVEAVRAELES